MLHLLDDQIAAYFVLLINLLVFLRNVSGAFFICFDIGIKHLFKHLSDVCRHRRDFFFNLRHARISFDKNRFLGNADGMVTDAFKIGAGFQNADDRAKIACDRLLQGNQLQSLVFKLHFAAVYFPIIAYDLVCELLVMFDEGFGRTINLFADVDAHFHKTNVEFSQLIIKYFMHQKFPLIRIDRSNSHP